MPERIGAPEVGAPDPEKNNSMVVEETDEEFEVAGMEMSESDNACYFNNVEYRRNQYVCSGDELLQCRNGVWVRMGTCVPDNP